MSSEGETTEAGPSSEATAAEAHEEQSAAPAAVPLTEEQGPDSIEKILA